jgi:hypothetical protein
LGKIPEPGCKTCCRFAGSKLEPASRAPDEILQHGFQPTDVAGMTIGDLVPRAPSMCIISRFSAVDMTSILRLLVDSFRTTILPPSAPVIGGVVQVRT